MQLNSIDLFFWAAGLLGHIALLVVLFGRRRAAVFPFFTALIVSNIVRTVVLVLVAHFESKQSYRIIYTSFASVDLLLQLCVVYELASQVFRPTGRWAPDAQKGILVMSAVSVVIAAGLAFLPSVSAKAWLASVLNRGNLFSSALLCELFVCMIALSVTVRLPWKTHVARIAQGLGFYSLLGLLTEAGLSVFGMERGAPIASALTFVRFGTYLVCLAYWLITLWLEAPAPRELPEEMRKQLFTLQTRLEYDLRQIRAYKR